MSLIDRDIIKPDCGLAFILLTKAKSKIIGIYTDLSNALKYLYLADEPANLYVSKVDKRSKPCINDSYDNYVGVFSFEGGGQDDLIYTRNLTGECEVVAEDKLINKIHYDEIIEESNQVMSAGFALNDYNQRAHEAVNNAIVRKFNLLSSWLVTRVNPKICTIIEHEIELDYNLTFQSNTYYQELSEQLDVLTIEEKVHALHKINKFIEEAISQNDMCDEISKQMDIEFEPDHFETNTNSSSESLGDMSELSDLFGDMCDLSDEESMPSLGKYKIHMGGEKKNKSTKNVTFKMTPEIINY